MSFTNSSNEILFLFTLQIGILMNVKLYSAFNGEGTKKCFFAALTLKYGSAALKMAAL